MTTERDESPGAPPKRAGLYNRDQTDESLRAERDQAEHCHEEERQRAEARADEALPTAGRQTDERVDAVAVERSIQRDRLAALLEVERTATDQDLSGERSQVDKMNADLREANAQMVTATIRAHELTDEAHSAKASAEASERGLREVAEFREMFIGILGHDLRNPLSSVKMAAGTLLRRGRLVEQDAASVTRIIRSAQRMGEMITQLLDLTRARLGGGLAIEPASADLQSICREVIEEFESPLDLQVEGDLRGTWDSARLAQALSNLVGNATEYAAPGTTVTVKARAVGSEVEVEVCNQGAPIPAEVLPELFEPFRRGTPRKQSSNGNLGLGLYIARQIALAHQGTLAARSAGGTTTFTLRIPRHCGPPPEPEPVQAG